MLHLLNGCKTNALITKTFNCFIGFFQGGGKESFAHVTGTSWRHQPFEDTDILSSVDLLEDL